MEGGNQLAQPWREDGQIPARPLRFKIVMRNTCGHENSWAGRSFHLFITQPESQCSLENVPGLVVCIVDVQVARTAPAPLVDLKGTSGCGDWRLFQSRREAGADSARGLGSNPQARGSLWVRAFSASSQRRRAHIFRPQALCRDRAHVRGRRISLDMPICNVPDHHIRNDSSPFCSLEVDASSAAFLTDPPGGEDPVASR